VADIVTYLFCVQETWNFSFALRTLIVFVIFVVLVESGERMKTISFRTCGDDDMATAQNECLQLYFLGIIIDEW
jgi:hypothetical protein